MAKRKNTSGQNSRGPGPNSSQKRVKVERIDGQAETTSLTDVQSANTSRIHRQRDSDYYFNDGSIVFQVKDTLFKVHSSLLQLRSKDFEKVFNIPPNTSVSLESGGDVGCDENPIIISDLSCRQFRSLMKIIYCQPTDRIFSTPPTEYVDEKGAARDFTFYVDVAKLSRRFAMEEIETWAKQRLARLAHSASDDIPNGFWDPICEGAGTHYQDPLEHTGQERFSYVGVEFPIVEAIRYAREVSDCSLHYDCLNLMQYIYDSQDANIKFILSYLRIPNLRETDPSLFGYLFLTILNAGSSAWANEMFTQMDRMALFSAQVFLAPLPDSLKASLAAPLFKEPNFNFFIQTLSDNTVRQSCTDQCYPTAFCHWQVAFKDYYHQLDDRDPRVPIAALGLLPVHRRTLFSLLQKGACPQECYRVVLGKTDQAIQELYSRLAEYYKPIN